jgi:predicted AlkP superfamily pyrophosphatase or phosphodiesterase
MVNNEFFDAALGRFFRYSQEGSVRDSRWWTGEPIWATAIKQGKLAATSFWVGSEAEIGGLRPTYWRPFDPQLLFEPRLLELIGWLKKPVESRPSFIAVYLEETNGAGHRFGPKSPELAAAIRLVDERLGELLRQCSELGFTPNVIVVSDHGMTDVDPARVSVFEDYIDVNAVQIEWEGSVAGLRPTDGDVDSLLQQVSRIPHVKAYKRAELPARLHVSENPRIPPIWLLPDEGAQIVRRTTLSRFRNRFPQHGYLPGDHGYDPAFRSMHGLFVAHGPAFRRGITLPSVENIHVYNLLCAVLGVTPARNSGDDRLVRAVLRK